jgi:hypothetical protein
MTIISDACTIKIINDASMIVIDNSRVTLQIVAPLTDNSRGVIYNRNMFIEQATVHGLFDEASLCLLCTLSKTPSDLLTFWSSPFPPHTKIRCNNIRSNDILSNDILLNVILSNDILSNDILSKNILSNDILSNDILHFVI